MAPSIAALRAEGLDTASVERLFVRRLALLTTSRDTFNGSLETLRQLAALLPDDPCAVQAPPGATQLGVTLWRYPTAAAYLLTRANLASMVASNLRLRRQLGISDAATIAAFFRHKAALVSNLKRGEAMVAHLQSLQFGCDLPADQGEHVGQGYVAAVVRCAPFPRHDTCAATLHAAAIVCLSCSTCAEMLL